MRAAWHFTWTVDVEKTVDVDIPVDVDISCLPISTVDMGLPGT